MDDYDGPLEKMSPAEMRNFTRYVAELHGMGYPEDSENEFVGEEESAYIPPPPQDKLYPGEFDDSSDEE